MTQWQGQDLQGNVRWSQRFALGVVALGVVGVVGCKSATSETTDAGGTTGTTDGGVVDTGTGGGTGDTVAPVDNGSTTGTDTKVPIDTAKPPTDKGEDTGTPAGLACRQVLDCTLACADSTCAAACGTGAEQAVLDGTKAVITCMEACTLKDRACALAKCYAEVAACYYGGKSGTVGCSKTVECINACGTDAGCTTGCLANMKPAAQEPYVKYIFCTQDAKAEHCKDIDEQDCKKQVDHTWCGAQYDKCLGDKQ